MQVGDHAVGAAGRHGFTRVVAPGEQPCNDARIARSLDEILALTISEPAMGSSAFLIEAVDQLADAYLEARQEEKGEKN